VIKCGGAGQATVDNIIWRMRFACWITKATDTHSEYVILIALPRQNGYANAPQLSHYTYIVSRVVIVMKPTWIFRYYTVYVNSVFAQSHATTNLTLRQKSILNKATGHISYTLLVLYDMLLVNGAAF
jgi:hypothetical protein